MLTRYLSRWPELSLANHLATYFEPGQLTFVNPLDDPLSTLFPVRTQPLD